MTGGASFTVGVSALLQLRHLVGLSGFQFLGCPHEGHLYGSAEPSGLSCSGPISVSFPPDFLGLLDGRVQAMLALASDFAK